MRRWTTLAALSGATLLWALPATAQQPRRGALVIPLEQGFAGQADGLGVAIEASLSRRKGDSRLISLIQRCDQEGEGARGAAAVRGRRALGDAEELADAFDGPGSEAAYAEAIAAFSVADLRVHRVSLVHAHIGLGAARHLAGDAKAAAAEFERALALDPDFRPDEQRYGAKLLGDFEALRSGGGEARLSVRVAGQEGLIYIDGVLAGFGDAERRVRRGRHYVSVAKPGALLWHQAVEVEKDTSVRASLEAGAENTQVKAFTDRLLGPMTAADPDDAGADLAKWLGVDELFLAGVSRGAGGRVKVKAWRVSASGAVLGKVVRQLALTPDTLHSEAGALVDELIAAAPAEAPAAGEAPSREAPPPPPPESAAPSAGETAEEASAAAVAELVAPSEGSSRFAAKEAAPVEGGVAVEVAAREVEDEGAGRELDGPPPSPAASAPSGEGPDVEKPSAAGAEDGRFVGRGGAPTGPTPVEEGPANVELEGPALRRVSAPWYTKIRLDENLLGWTLGVVAVGALGGSAYYGYGAYKSNQAAHAIPQVRQAEIQVLLDDAWQRSLISDGLLLTGVMGLGTAWHFLNVGGAFSPEVEWASKVELSPVPLREGAAVVVHGRW